MTDDFTREHMAGGNVVLRDKRVAGGLQVVMLAATAISSLTGIGGLLALAAGAGGSLGGVAAGVGLGLGAMFGSMWLTGSVLRTVVTEDELHVSGGLPGTRIALGRIQSCRIGEQHGRLRVGKRYEDGMWTSSYLIALGEYVEVIWMDDRGKARRFLFTPGDPRAVLAAVQERTRARVEVDAAPAEREVVAETSAVNGG